LARKVPYPVCCSKVLVTALKVKSSVNVDIRRITTWRSKGQSEEKGPLQKNKFVCTGTKRLAGIGGGGGFEENVGIL